MVSAKEEKAHFEALFAKIKSDLVSELEQFDLPKNGKEWINKLIDHTIQGGKMNRGLAVVSSLRALVAPRELTETELFKAELVGWCIEILQAFFLVADDIMDSSVTRRGLPCWYKMDGVGLIAINDSFILEQFIYRLLRTHLKTDPCYIELIDLFHETTYQTTLGQLMDLITAPEDDVDLTRFSIQKHAYIVEYKTAYYSFYLPVASAMLLSGITNPESFSLAKSILLPLGEYFQVQDDYLDCFGDPAVIGKIGTDIEDNKCSWLINQALSIVSKEQRDLLDLHYGKRSAESAAIVKKIYNEINLPKIYAEYEETSHKKMMALINDLDEQKTGLPREMFTSFVNRIYKRSK
ncbi:hypothetical protein HK098_007726 [Nowakowskiella sp. JEL0407]|nr:hypothetical protein HK098_007726 [Nowakowskiella sp. JEL0407]